MKMRTVIADDEVTEHDESVPQTVDQLLAQLKSDVTRGRGTDGADAVNDIDLIELWRSGRE
jgi:hypothetical protein